MARSANARSIRVLYIGRVDDGHAHVWHELATDGCIIDFARNQTIGLQMARALKPNIVVINTINSSFSGKRLCRLINSRMPQAKRLVIAEQGEDPRMECEERLNRPFTARKLRDTVRKLVERTVPHVLRAGPVELDLISRVVTTSKGGMHLTPKQCKLLAMFMQRPNQVISREDLMQEIWDTGFLDDTRTLDVHIRWVREKIEADPTHPVLLVTHRGIGYKLVLPPEPSGDRAGSSH